MQKLSGSQLEEALADLPAWSRTGEVLERTFEFPDFEVAMAFVNQVAWAAEKVNHHPDIDIRWNRVRLALTTHDAGGLTSLDMGLAAQSEFLAAQITRNRAV
jgi:4a-hydroxytetrahydrobiopterin dehydratase